MVYSALHGSTAQMEKFFDDSSFVSLNVFGATK